MTSGSAYSAAQAADAAIAELRKHAGSQFDPSVVGHMAAIVENVDFELGHSPQPTAGATR